MARPRTRRVPEVGRGGAAAEETTPGEVGHRASRRAGNVGDVPVPLLPAAVTRVVDDDTVYVRLDDGREEKVRLIRVDTPESTTQVEPYGKEAAAYTESRLDGKKIYLELDPIFRTRWLKAA